MTGVALLGAGFMGRTHAEAYARLGTPVRMVCARSEQAAAPLAEQLGARVAVGWEAAIDAADVDAVDVCLPTPLHRPVAERALAAGRHVLLEKPLALTLDDADAIGAAAETSGRVLAVGHVLRFVPEVRELERVLASGELGLALAATALRLSTPPDWNDWMLDPGRSGGVIVDLMIHDLDLVQALLGPAVRVHARGWPDHVTALVEHAGGDAAVEASHAMPPSFPFTAGLRVLCERGVLEHRFEAGANEAGGNLGSVTSVLRVHPTAGPAREFAEPADPWQAMIAAFLEAVADGTPVRRGSFADARAALALALAARRSLASGRAEGP